MFNIKIEKKQALKRHKKELDLIDKCKGVEKHVSWISSMTYDIYTKEYSYKEYVQALREISKTLKGKRVFVSYYCSGDCLMINYRFGCLSIIFECYEAEIAIEKLGKGKCRIVKKTETNNRVVCDV